MKIFDKNKIIISALLLLVGIQANAETNGLQLTGRVEPTVIDSPDIIRISAFLNAKKDKSNGLGIAIAFDSSKISFEHFSHSFPSGLISNASTTEVDSADIDNNPQTDSLVRIAWVDLMGNWKGIDYDETHLLTADFVVEQDNEQQAGLTTVTFSSLSNAGTDTFAVVKQPVKIEGSLK